jgi:hypothetical protein
MKKILVLFFLFFILPNNVSAHAIGQPPFFKVNSTFTDYYHIPSSSTSDFELPQDTTPKSFLVGEKIEFEIDTTQLPVPKEILDKTSFEWDYGDSSKATGLKNGYSYSKAGSFILKIMADSGEGTGPQLLQSTFINIIPTTDYKLPQAIIEVNGWMSKDPLTDVLDTKFNQDFKFSAEKSQPGSSEIVEYFWDLGDGNTAKGAEITHNYSTNPYTVFPILRIKTQDGFISDSFIQIKDKSFITGGNTGGFLQDALSDDRVSGKPNFLRYALIGIGILVGIYVVAFIISKLKSQKSKLRS